VRLNGSGSGEEEWMVIGGHCRGPYIFYSEKHPPFLKTIFSPCFWVGIYSPCSDNLSFLLLKKDI
jgi:hypothetical protein